MAPTDPDAPVETLEVLPNITHQNWLRDPGLWKLNLGIAFMFTSSAGMGYTGSLINGLLVLPEFTKMIRGLSPNIVGLFIAATSLGGLISYVPASYMADILGRKLCVRIGCCLTIVASVIQATLQNDWVFFGSRVLAGAGVGIAQIAAPSLVAEIAHPRHRQTATCLYNAAWCFGSIVSAAVTFATLSITSSWSWRFPCLLQAIYPIIQLAGLLYVPESPRWLVSKNRNDEALAILAKYHANGYVDDDLVQHEFLQICNSISQESRSWSSLFSSKGDLHRLTICIMVGFMQEWAGNGIIAYYLAPVLTSVGITRASEQAAINVGLQTWNLLLCSTGAVASERYGRRILWLLSTTAMLICLSITTLMASLFAEKHIAAAGVAVVPMLSLFYGAFDLAYAPLFIAYPTEILPFQIRAKGLAITFSTDAVACFFNQYVNPMAFSAMQWRYYCVYIGCLVLFLGFVYFLFPETKGRSLEDVSKIFDHNDIQCGTVDKESEVMQ